MSNMVKVESEFDPQRCKASNKSSQCMNKCEEGFDYCNYHNSGQRLLVKKEKEHQYLLTRWRAEIDHYSNNSQVKSLREEIGILRLLMQTALNRCLDADDLMIHAGRIMELTARIERVVQTCHTMEEKTQFLVDKQQIVHLAEQILLIITEFVTDPNVLANIADRIKGAIEAKSTVTVDKSGKIIDTTDAP